MYVPFNSTELLGSTTLNSSEEIARLIQLIVRPILVLFGTVGNILSFYIMRSGSLGNLSTCFYMSVLALVDTGERIFGLIKDHLSTL